MFEAEILGVAVDEDVAGVGAFADGAEGEAGGEFGGEVLEAVDGDIGAVLEEGDFEFLGEKSLGEAFTLLGEGGGLELVASGLDDFKLEGKAREGGAALGENDVGLREGQGTSAGCDGKKVFVGNHG